MDTFISFLLGLLKAIFQNVIWEIIKRKFSNTFLNPESRFYYEKMMMQLKERTFELKVAVAFLIYGLLTKFNFVRTISREQIKLAIAAIVATIIVAVIYALYTRGKKEDIILANGKGVLLYN